MSSNELLSRIESGKAAVLSQVDLFHHEFGRAQTTVKYDGTRVTAVDVAISENIFKDLRRQYPEDQYFSEELAEDTAVTDVSARFSWMLDPIDGTNNYASGIAECAIALALMENGVPVYGMVYDLGRRTLMHGGPGFGTFDGTRAAKVRAGTPDAQSMIGFHSPYNRIYSNHAKIMVEHFKIRGLGSSTLHLAYVAVGLLDGTLDHNVKIWDIAAAVPLCLAAGGEVQFLNGEQFPLRKFDLKMGRIQYVAGNRDVCARIRELIGL